MTFDTRGEIDATLKPIELQCNWDARELSVSDILAVLLSAALITISILFLLKQANII